MTAPGIASAAGVLQIEPVYGIWAFFLLVILVALWILLAWRK